jgi:hypothetical protein
VPAAGDDSVQIQVVYRIDMTVGLVDQLMSDDEWSVFIIKKGGADLAFMTSEQAVRVTDIEFIRGAELVNNGNTAGARELAEAIPGAGEDFSNKALDKIVVIFSLEHSGVQGYWRDNTSDYQLFIRLS